MQRRNKSGEKIFDDVRLLCGHTIRNENGSSNFLDTDVGQILLRIKANSINQITTLAHPYILICKKALRGLVPPKFGRLQCVALVIKNDHAVAQIDLVQVLEIFSIIRIEV